MQAKGTGRGRGGEWDVEAVLDELYVTRPSEFVARREELALTARTAGRAEDARRIHAARRPTTAAWAANLLLRSAPEESRQFLELGRKLREAYGTLDASGLKDLSAQRRRVVSALSREAAGLAREAGLRLSAAVQQEVESTLQAVLADPGAADRWATGRLAGALTPPSDFPSGAGAGAVTKGRSGPAPAEAAPRSARRGTKDELAERRRRQQEELARARAAAEAAETAERHLRDRRAEHADAEESLRQARDRHDEAGQRVAVVERQLDEAREEFERIGRERNEAEERQRSAADALARAEREAREAAKEAERLAGPHRS
jgi:hypothetical protein